MQPEQPLLTIAIPTYNRSALLRQLLHNLKDQLADEPRVELLISNNASTDDTKEVIELLCRQGLVARRIHNQTDIGADGNFLQCFQEATGKYLWLFSDDDVIVPGGVKKILAELAQTDYDLIHINSYAFHDAGRSFPDSTGARPPEVFCSAPEFAARIHVFFTFISGNIVNRNKILSSGPHPFSQLVGTNLVQLGWTYVALRAATKNLYIHERLVGNRADNTGGYALCQIFGVNLQKITREWLADTTLERVIISGVLRRFLPPYLYSFRTQNGRMRFKTEDAHQVLSPIFRQDFRYWVFDYPVIVLPRTLASVWVFVGRVINKIDKILGFPSLRSAA